MVAAPDEFETSTDPAETGKFITPGKGHPDKVVRLKAQVARQNRLLSKWTVVTKEYDGKDSPKGSIILQQPWDTGTITKPIETF